MKSNKFTIEESSNGGGISNEKKSCAICGTSKTPLWRSGPAGPKVRLFPIRFRFEVNPIPIPIRSDLSSFFGVGLCMQSLCNACGIRNRKKRRTVIVNRSEDKKKKNHMRNPKIGDSLKQRLMELGREVMLQRSTAENQRLGEEEQAALLLMALSYASSVYA